MGFKGYITTISSFQRREYDVYYWKIDKFSSVTEKAAQNDHYTSSSFNFKDLGEFCLIFYPNGLNNNPGIIGLNFLLHNPTANSCIHLTMGLKTQSGRIEKCFNNYIFPTENIAMTTPAFISKSEFLKRKEELAPSDCLTFAVFLSREPLNITRDVADKTETRDAKEKDEEEKEGVEKVAGDISKLLVSGNGSDAMIVVQGVEYKIHSCILAARTPVFAALFEHDTLEKETRKVTISDCEPAIFKEFLNYIYSGSVQDLTAKKALGIYVVADKYLVDDLKKKCRRCIQDNINSETFCEAVQIALRCKDEDLLESAVDYFAIHMRHIIRSVEWQKYIEENPREANEIFIRSLGPSLN